MPASKISFNTATDLSWGDMAVDNRESPRMVQIHLNIKNRSVWSRGRCVHGSNWHRYLPSCSIGTVSEDEGPGLGSFLVNSAGEVESVVVSRIRDILQRQGIPAHKYAGHSFRIGAATTAALVGVKDSMNPY